MDALERDYPAVLLADHQPPCVSLYQPTYRHHPSNLQDPIRFRNLVKTVEASLRQQYRARETWPILAPFGDLAEDRGFWNHTLDGLAVLATADLFKVYRLQRPVPELAVVAESFHIKPLLRILQSADQYQILGLTRHTARLFEGNRDVLDEIELAAGVPHSIADVVGEGADEPERKSRVYGSESTEGKTRHGTDVKEEKLAKDTERFFRAVDLAILERYSQPGGLPLLLAALPEYHHLFRSVSRNGFLLAEAIASDPAALSMEELRAQAWQLMLPHYLERLQSFVERFGAASGNGRGTGDVADAARAAAAHRIEFLLIEAERTIPGRFDPETGAIGFAGLGQPGVDDLLDDIGERTLRAGGEVVVVPAERMPTKTGIAAVYRY
ncbi:MAG: hypothetical protein ACREFP_12270 [Acetobacteraceae bacterium]